MSKRRLLAFFHDPIHKALVLTTKRGHESVAKELARTFGIELTDDALEFLKSMDILASATERLALPEGADTGPEYQIMEVDKLGFRHPMSGVFVPLNLQQEDFQSADHTLKETLREFACRLKDKDEKEKLEYLWHHLLETLTKKNPDIPWQLLPADTRVPDHTIWSHLKLSTATQIEALTTEAGKTIPYATASLFIFTIGPVQSFIRQARKTQDLWAGSFILSYLTFKAVEVLIKEFSSTVIIYPDLQAHPWILQEKSTEIVRPTIPNRFVAILPETDPGRLQKLGKACSEAVKTLLKNWSEYMLERIGLKDDTSVKRVFERQLNSAFAYYWIAFPLPEAKNGKKDYESALELIETYLELSKVEKARKLIKFAKSSETLYKPNIGTLYEYMYSYLEKALAARKTLRDKVFGEPEPSNEKIADKSTRVERCHMCGERNAAIFRRDSDLYWYDEEKFEWRKRENVDIGFKYVQRNEAICSVCLIKRFLHKILSREIKNFPPDYSFPSVADVAVADFEEEIIEKTSGELNSFEKVIEKIHEKSDISYKITSIPRIVQKKEKFIEGEWFYETSLNKDVIKRSLGVEVDERVIEEARQRLKDLRDAIGKKPCPYYAFIAIDGDHMGKWLAGKMGFGPDEDRNIYHPEVWKNLPYDFKKEMKSLFYLEDGKWGRPVTPAFHASIAQALQNFALKLVPKIVEGQYLGQIIYAGGDDILAFVNLRDLWDVLRLLRAAYSGMIKFEDGKILLDKSNKTGIVKSPEGYLLTMGTLASLSAGVVIAHYKTPLYLVIQEGLDMEKKAKNFYGRNAFAIRWLKHSGEITEAGGKWYIEKEEDLIGQVQDVIEIFLTPLENQRKYSISKGFLKELKGYLRLIGEKYELIEPLIKRAIDRHIRFTENKLSRDEKETLKADVEEKIFNLINTLENSVESFINLIEIGLLYHRFSGKEEE